MPSLYGSEDQAYLMDSRLAQLQPCKVNFNNIFYLVQYIKNIGLEAGGSLEFSPAWVK